MTKNYALRLPEELHKTLKKSAEKNRRSLNSEIIRAIEMYLEAQKEAKKSTPPQ